MRPTILFLYSEIAEYFVSACTKLAEYANVEIIHWPVAKEAPFELSQTSDLNFTNRNKFNTKEELIKRVAEINPNLIVTSGWLDKGYMEVCKKFAKKVPVVVSMDNHWNGSVKQHLGRLLSPFVLHNRFSYIWVPGQPQKQYALKLGFKENQIITGFYAANVEHFEAIAQSSLSIKESNYPKTFFYLGRYVKHKGIFDIWEAFKIYRQKGGTWNMISAGTGDQWENRVEVEGLQHVGFIQPKEISKYLPQVGCYVLPSHFEPWGVSVHEMAAAGLPLLLSDKVGSMSQFLSEGENGYRFKPGNINEIVNLFFKIEKLNQKQLIHFSEKSREKAKSITQNQWVKSLLKVLNKSNKLK